MAAPDARDRTNEIGEGLYVELPPATGGTDPVSYTLTGLPPGLSFNNTIRIVGGSVSGMPAGYEVTYTATDATGTSVSVTFRWTLVAAMALPAVISPSILEPPVRSGDSRESALPEDEFANSPYPRGSDVWDRMTKEV